MGINNKNPFFGNGRPPGRGKRNRTGIRTDSWPEKVFMVVMFIVIELMVYGLCFDIIGHSLDEAGLPDLVRDYLRLAQLAVFIILSYAVFMMTFFKTNVFLND